MEGFRFASSLTDVEYQKAQRLVAKEKPGIYFFAYVWPKLGYALGAILLFATLLLGATGVHGALLGLVLGGFLVGSALWLHFGTQHRISELYRSAGLWHKMSINADAAGISMDCETGTKAYIPWCTFSRVLASDSILVLMQSPERFAVVSLSELDQPSRTDLVNFASEKVVGTEAGA